MHCEAERLFSKVLIVKKQNFHHPGYMTIFLFLDFPSEMTVHSCHKDELKEYAASNREKSVAGIYETV
jgi:hypothetical protein